MIDNLSKIVSLVETDVVVQQIIVNNEIQNVTAKGIAMMCPTCGRVIQQFQAGIPKLACVREIMPHREELTKRFQYCVQCGQKLNYNFDIFEDEVEAEVVNEESSL